MIRVRRHASGRVVYDVQFAVTDGGYRGSVHLGTVDSEAEARLLERCWRDSVDMDKAILRARKLEAERSARRARHWALTRPCGWSDHGPGVPCPDCDEAVDTSSRVRPGDPTRPRQASGWPSDPVGDLAAVRADRARERESWWGDVA